jgi:hypothetical protein
MKKINYILIKWLIAIVDKKALQETLKELAKERFTTTNHFAFKVKRGKCRYWIEAIEKENQPLIFIRSKRHESRAI